MNDLNMEKIEKLRAGMSHGKRRIIRNKTSGSVGVYVVDGGGDDIYSLEFESATDADFYIAAPDIVDYLIKRVAVLEDNIVKLNEAIKFAKSLGDILPIGKCHIEKVQKAIAAAEAELEKEKKT